MRILMDEDADARIGAFLQSRGHTVDYSRKILGRGSPDHLVAAAADQLGAIVVTRNYRHFRRLIRRTPEDLRPSFPRAGLICFRCDDARALERITDLIDAIEVEYALVQQRSDSRLIVAITDKTLAVIR
jgi:hypothetical protein